MGFEEGFHSPRDLFQNFFSQFRVHGERKDRLTQVFRNRKIGAVQVLPEGSLFVKRHRVVDHGRDAAFL